MTKTNLFKSIGIVTIITLITKIAGFIREVVIGVNLGTTKAADFVTFALTFPTFLYLIVGGAFTTAFITVYQKIETLEKKGDFVNNVNKIVNIIVFLLVIGLLILLLIFPSIFRYDTISFLLVLPALFFYIKASFFSGVLNAYKHFIESAYALLLNNLTFLLIITILDWMVEEQIYIYTLSFTIASSLMYFYLRLKLKKLNLHPKKSRLNNLKGKSTKRLFSLSLPIILGGASTQLLALFQRFYAVKLEEGYIAAVNYASKLVLLPQGIIMTGVTTVIFPYLAQMAGKKEYEKIGNMYYTGERMLFYILIFISINVFILSEDIVKLIFEYGSFDKHSTYKTSIMLKFMVTSMYFSASSIFITRYYYAFEQNKFPVITGFITVFILNPIFFILLFPFWGEIALPLATTFSVVIQHFLLRQKLGKILKIPMLDIRVFLLRLLILTLYLGTLLIFFKTIDHLNYILRLTFMFVFQIILLLPFIIKRKHFKKLKES
ncbi:murein biosynthesis integral membrane protein MurJ [Rossellomorea vietnamensis]|uniref:murein biosynthesis integral membrane protein MurJ n=1 Tax=Rossellomorea vietnamensis TaxID=218284 RepID=UPI003CF3CEFB